MGVYGRPKNISRIFILLTIVSLELYIHKGFRVPILNPYSSDSAYLAYAAMKGSRAASKHNLRYPKLALASIDDVGPVPECLVAT